MKKRKPRRDAAYRECNAAAVKAYQGKRPPYCNNGRGCRACWTKWRAVQATKGRTDG